MSERMYSSKQVCQAIGLRRTTFDAWILRKYLDLPDGPGTGRERKFTAFEATLITMMDDLTKLGLTASNAARVTMAVRDRSWGNVFYYQTFSVTQDGIELASDVVDQARAGPLIVIDAIATSRRTIQALHANIAGRSQGKNRTTIAESENV